MDIQEQLRSTIHRIDEAYFLEEVYHTHSRETDYWLGKYASDRRVWVGSGPQEDNTGMTLDEAKTRATTLAVELEK